MSTYTNTPATPYSPGPNVGQEIIHGSLLHKPGVDPKYHERYPNDFQLMQLLFLTGRSTHARNDVCIHYERPRNAKAVQMALNAVPGAAGATHTVTLTAGSHNAGGQSFPILNDVVMFKNNVIGQVIAKRDTGAQSGANELDIAPLKSTDAIPAVAADEYLIVLTNMHPTGSNAPNSRTWDPYKVESYMQIFRNSYEVHNSAMASQMWVNVEMREGDPAVTNKLFKPGDYKVWADTQDTYRLFMTQIELGLMFNVSTDNTTITNPGNNATQRSVHGVVPSIQDAGLNPAAYTAGAYNLTQLEATTTLIHKNGGAKEYTYWMGLELNHEYNSFIHDLYQNGAVTYGAFGNDSKAKERAVTYGFSSFTVDNITFHKKVYQPFVNPELLGAPGFGYEGAGFMLPMDRVMDAKSNKRLDSIQLKHRGDGRGIDRSFIVSWTGGMNGQQKLTTSATDVTGVNYLSERTVQTVAMNRFVYQARA